MTAKELIERLLSMPAGASVFIGVNNHGPHLPVNDIARRTTAPVVIGPDHQILVEQPEGPVREEVWILASWKP